MFSFHKLKCYQFFIDYTLEQGGGGISNPVAKICQPCLSVKSKDTPIVLIILEDMGV
jgi:hypothetical protein